jgi:hypothetical protein
MWGNGSDRYHTGKGRHIGIDFCRRGRRIKYERWCNMFGRHGFINSSWRIGISVEKWRNEPYDKGITSYHYGICGIGYVEFGLCNGGKKDYYSEYETDAFGYSIKSGL